MLLRLLFLQFVSLTFANPFHKYPYVFLLDVGNEEVQKTAEEQIRVSIPGGSLAVRYPAVGDGKTITHIRVTGIDFGTDLKANILDGGPGYKYVVLVFMGNLGVPYDAVVTVQTMVNEIEDADTPEPQTNDNGNNYEVAETDQDNQTNNYSKENPSSFDQELTQETVISPNYVSNLKIDDDYEENNSAEDNSDSEDIYIPKKEDYNQEAESIKQNEEEEVEDEIQNISPVAEKYTAANEQQPSAVDKNLYEKYMILRPHLYNMDVYNQDNVEYNSRPNYYEDPVELDQMFNDEEVHNDANKYSDDNQNSNDDRDISDNDNAVDY